MTVRRRKFIRIISYLVAVCIVFAVSGIFSEKVRADYENTLERVRFESLASLTEYSREISSGLRLLAVSAGDSLPDSAAYVCSRSLGAMGCLGSFNENKTLNISTFFSGVYDFAEDFSGNEESRKTAVLLSDYAQDMYYHLSDLVNDVTNGKYALSEYDSLYQKDKTEFFEDVLDFESGREEELFPLIESAAVTGQGFYFLDGRNSISADEAKKIASDITGISSVLWRDGGIKTSDGCEAYRLICGDTGIDICKAGGVIMKIINPMPCKSPVYSVKDAYEKAVDFLESNGFYELTCIKMSEEKFTAEFLFVPCSENVYQLKAGINIDICLASGKTVYFDATDYIGNYRSNIRFSEKIPDIRGVIPECIDIKDTLLCVDDIDGAERFCILALCSYADCEALIYIDYYSLKILKTALVS